MLKQDDYKLLSTLLRAARGLRRNTSMTVMAETLEALSALDHLSLEGEAAPGCPRANGDDNATWCRRTDDPDDEGCPHYQGWSSDHIQVAGVTAAHASAQLANLQRLHAIRLETAASEIRALKNEHAIRLEAIEGSARKQDIRFRRGEADGRQGHPPAEITVAYLRGYAEGLDQRP